MACLTSSPTFHFSQQVGFDQSCSPTESKRSEKPSATCRHNVNSSVIDAPVGSMVGLSDDHLMMTSGCRQERLSGDTHCSSTFETSNAHLRELSAHCPRPGSNAERLAHGIPPGVALIPQGPSRLLGEVDATDDVSLGGAKSSSHHEQGRIWQ